MNKPTFGAIDFLDPRTVDINELELSGIGEVPAQFQTTYTFPVYNQLHHQCCVAFATARQLEIWEAKQGKAYRKISEAFIWIHAKKDDGLPLSSGTYNLQGMKSVNKYGYVYSDEWDKSVNLSQEEFAKDDIPQNIKDLALTRKMNYAGVLTANVMDWNKAIYTYGATTCPIVLSKDWWTVNGVYNYDVQDPLGSPKYPLDYGHSMLAIGYDLSNKTIVNSWGENWSRDGKGGFSTNDYKPHSTAYFFTGPVSEVKPPSSTLPKITDFKYNPITLKLGQRSENVRQLQIALRLLGFITKDEFLTGYYGPKTQEAVLNFQRTYMLKHRIEVENLKGSQVGNKTNKELINQLTILKNKALQVNSNSTVPIKFQSSQDPEQVSLRIKALLFSMLPAGLIVSKYLGLDFTEDQAIELITAVTAFVSVAMYVYGFLRSLKSDNSI